MSSNNTFVRQAKRQAKRFAVHGWAVQGNTVTKLRANWIKCSNIKAARIRFSVFLPLTAYTTKSLVYGVITLTKALLLPNWLLQCSVGAGFSPGSCE